jgi:hypothetical protein
VVATADVAAAWGAPGVLYAGGERDGLHRSADCGATWEHIPVPAAPGVPGRTHRTSEGVPAVAADATGRVYVGGGYDPIMLTDDGGRTWQHAVSAAGRLFARSRGIVTSPAAPGVAYASLHPDDTKGPQGLSRSLDGGLTWEVRRAQLWPLAADALAVDVLYSAWGGMLRRSLDGGRTFSVYAPFEQEVAALVMSVDGTRFWLASTDGGFYRSADRGLTWERVEEPPAPARIVRLAADPHEVRRVFAVTHGGELWMYYDEEGLAARDGQLPSPAGAQAARPGVRLPLTGDGSR